MWMVTYNHDGWSGVVRTCDRDCAIDTAQRLASEGKSEISVHDPDGRATRVPLGVAGGKRTPRQ